MNSKKQKCIGNFYKHSNTSLHDTTGFLTRELYNEMFYATSARPGCITKLLS